MTGKARLRAVITGAAFVLAGVALGACESGAATGAQTATTPAAKVTASTPPAKTVTAKVTAPPSPTTTVSEPSLAPSARPQLPGVIDDCTAAPPLGEQSVAKPASITLACADGGLGIGDLVWSAWTASGATGTGRVWANDCTPNCAEGKFHYYPAAISLSGVKDTTKDGLLFSRVTVTYQIADPTAPALDNIPLPMPPE
jgi:hypothetical protein